MNEWIPLTGKLTREQLLQCTAVAVRYNTGQTAIKESSKWVLCQNDMSKIIKEYKLL